MDVVFVALLTNEVRNMMVESQEDISTILPPYTPDQIREAYHFPCDLSGCGHTIAIVVAYGNENILGDVGVFNKRYQLPPINLEILYPQGEPDFQVIPWQTETALDVEWVHALAPEAKIILVVARSAEDEDVFDAIRFASTLDVSIISMSFGTPESEELRAYDYIFETPGIVFVASSGDGGFVIYPSSNPNVVAAGGTSYLLDTCGKPLAEEYAWNESGGGISIIEPKPPWQYIQNDALPRSDMRTTPDISFFADQFPGVSYYATTVDVPNGKWRSTGGTSVSAPCIAAIFANAIPPGYQVSGATEFLYELAGGCCYTNPEKVYRDITNGHTSQYPALRGYDYVTGLGSLHVDRFIEVFQYYCQMY